MPTFGARAAAAAWPMLRRAGGLTEVTLTEVTITTNTTTGEVTRALVSETVDAKISPFRPDEVDGVRITAHDRKVLVQQADVVNIPTLDTQITFGGETWHMQSPPEPVSNDGLWLLHVRRVGEV